MLSKKNIKLLNKLSKMCDNGAYKVFDIDDLIAMSGMKIEELKENLKYLATLQFIDIKYSDESVFCLCLLAKSEVEIEELKNTAALNQKLIKIMFFTCLFSAISAFLGAFAAMFIIR